MGYREGVRLSPVIIKVCEDLAQPSVAGIDSPEMEDFEEKDPGKSS